jgi:hypothetical protein
MKLKKKKTLGEYTSFRLKYPFPFWFQFMRNIKPFQKRAKEAYIM